MNNLQHRLREYADIAEAGGKPHWAAAMRKAALLCDWLETSHAKEVAELRAANAQLFATGKTMYAEQEILHAALAARQAVQQWEYKMLWMPRHISSMEERLNAYGADGWEFCGIDHDGMHIFKRALATKEPQS